MNRSHHVFRFYKLLRVYRKSIRGIARIERIQRNDASTRRRFSLLCKRVARLKSLLEPMRRLAAFGASIMAGAGFVAYDTFAQTPVISTVSPAANVHNAANDANIDITFSILMDASTITGANIRIFGSQTGFLSSNGSFSGNPVRSFDPSSDFKPGELISISVTGASSSGGTPLAEPRVYSFRATSATAAAEFGVVDFSSKISLEVALGDLDGDGDLDAVVAGLSSGHQIWRNNGDGSFSSSSFAGERSRGVALGDLDSDGDLDAIFAGYRIGFDIPQEIWLNNGDATFSSSSTGTGECAGIALGDLDGDGDLDALLAVYNGQQQIWLGNDDGTFSSNAFGAANSSYSVELGDLDGDGDLDAIIANYSGSANEVWLNNGDGTFSTSLVGAAGLTMDVAIGDIDNDGDLDAVFCNQYAASYIWRNNGAASFTTSSFGPSNRSFGIQLGDVDGDGDLDAIVANFSNTPDEHEIWTNDGSGTFTTGTLVGDNGTRISMGDLDGDGDLDAVMANFGDPQEILFNFGPLELQSLDPDRNQLGVSAEANIEITFGHPMDAGLVIAAHPNSANLIAHGSQTGLISSTASLSFSNGNRKVILDPTADFKPGELVSVTVTGATSDFGEQLNPAQVYSFRATAAVAAANFGLLTFSSKTSHEVALGDLDGDGDLDAVLAGLSAGHEVWHNDGMATFVSSSFTGVRARGVALGDLDGDGDLDAFFAGYQFGVGQPQEIWRNNGDGTFTTATAGSGDCAGIALGDLDGDGDLDALLAGYHEQQQIWLNNGDGTFASNAFGATNRSYGVELGDLDGDGDLDAIIANYSNANEIWLNNGDGTFATSQFGPGDSSADVAIGDLDNDGDLDAIFANLYTSNVIWLGDGSGAFSSSSFGLSSRTFGVGLGDLDGDGDLDVIAANLFTDTGEDHELWLNDGSGNFTTSALSGDNGSRVSMGDLDGDGDLDAVIANFGPEEILLNIEPLTLVGLTPSRNAVGTPANSDVELLFSQPMNTGTFVTTPPIANANLILHGSQTGLISTGATVGFSSGNTQVIMDPVEDFKPGELISLSVTGASSAFGQKFEPALIYSFRATAAVAEAKFGLIPFSSKSSHEVALGDLDGDGDLDAVLAGLSAGHEVWINNGDGSFNSSSFAGTPSRGIALGDLDGDGDLDAFFAGYQFGVGQPQEIWLNNGDGTFTTATAGSGDCAGIALGDLDGDGDLDALLAGYHEQQQIWINNGDGSFASNAFGATNRSYSIELGDLDGDGDLDALIANYNNANEIWLNNGDGGFTTSLFGPVNGSTDIALGDLDADGDLDAIFTNIYTANAIWLGDGSGAFASSTFGPSSRTFGIQFGDVDGDGDLDAIAANLSSDSNKDHELWINDGSASFTTSALPGDNGSRIAMGDVDGDGDLDAVIANFGPEEILFNSGPSDILSLAPDRNAINVAESSDIDITFTTPMNTGALTTATITTHANLIVYGSQTGHITTLASLSFSNGDRTVTIDPAADFKPGEQLMVTVTNAQNFADIPITRASVHTFRAAVQSSRGAFGSNSFGTGASRDAALGDLDGDGDLDAIIANNNQAQEIWLNNGNGVFSTASFGSGSSRGVALGDLDGDGDLDAIIVNENQAQEIWKNNGNGSFSSGAFGSGASQDAAIADLDGDGDLDAIIANDNQAQEVWFNNGDGSFTSSAFGSGTSTDVALGDLDGDGDADAVIANYGQAQEVWLNNGAGGFSSSLFGSGLSRGIALGDLDGDGDLDAVISDYAGAQEIWSNNGAATFSSSAFGAGISEGLALGDLDGDGDLDAVIANRNQAQEVWQNLPPEPTITDIQPPCILQGSGTTTLNISGTGFTATTAQISTLNALGMPESALTLPIISSSATTLVVQIPGLAFATAGTLTISVANPAGSTNADLTVNPLINVTGASCGCPGVALYYSAEPTSTTATDTWTATGGYIIGGQGTSTVQVVWDQGAATSLSVTRSYQLGCTTAAILNVAPKSLIAAYDYATTATDTSVTLAVLSNDSGTNIALSSVSDPANGAASSTGGSVLYAPDAGFIGTDTFGYTITDAQGCQASGTISVHVIGAAQATKLAFDDVTMDGEAGVRGLRGPVATVVSGDGAHLYVAAQLSSSIFAFTRNSVDGGLALSGSVHQGRNGVDGLALTSDITLSADGMHLYAVGAGSDGISVFGRNATTGVLTFVEAKLNGAVDAGGAIAGLDRPTALALSPDGVHVYAAGYDAHSIVIFRRIPVSGALIYVGTATNGIGGVEGLRQTISVALSPDGKHLYAAGRKDNSVAVFSRDAASGTLSFIERYKDGVDGIDGLRKVTSVAISPDGMHVYATGSQDNALAVFRRNPTTGALTYIERHKDGLQGVSGLDGAFHVELSPNGATVFVAGEQAGAVSVFRRDLATGALTFLQRRVDDRGGVNGIARIRDVVVSPDNKHVYCVGMFDNAVVVFRAEN